MVRLHGGVWGNTSGCSSSRSAGVDECVTVASFDDSCAFTRLQKLVLCWLLVSYR